jgi:hypothetical protein
MIPTRSLLDGNGALLCIIAKRFLLSSWKRNMRAMHT